MFLGRPSELHDKIAAVLATDDLERATKRLADERKRTADVVKEATSRLTDLRRRAGELADERVAVFQDATKRNWDLDAVARLVDGSTGRHAETKPYDRLADLRAPERSRVEALCADLRSAADGFDATAGSGADLARQTATILRGALALHDAHGVEMCPVCERTPIDHEWRERAKASATELESAAAEATAVHRSAANAVGALQALASDVPLPASVPEVAGVDVAVARETLGEWHGLGASESDPASLRAAAERLEILGLELDEAFAEVRAAAVRERDALDAQWRSLAIEIAAWIPAGRAAESVKATTARLTSAEKWLKSAHDTIRNERLEPLSEQTMTTWKALQHESNVSLRDFKLTGSATRRSVDFEMAVDDVGGAALGVMSQGEINALALSVFLPRATLPESPFRFLVIDDPVQAMDPARVDGLARVLSDVAADRQVVVFTHDDRLTAALRRLRLPATVLEVSRRDQSVVTVRETRSPSHQPLEDARALSLDEAVPSAEKTLAIPILCREALEATLAERYRRSALQRGIEHRAVDDELANANTVTQVAALGLFGDRDRGADVLPYFDRLASRFADVMRALKRGAHHHHGGDLRLLVADTSDLVNRLEAER